MKKLSVVTAVHNQIEYSRLFLESLEKYTSQPYQLVVVDNASRDGSADFFEENGAEVIRNPRNLCYGCSQNLGLTKASGDYVAFLNNDIYLSRAWDAILLGYMDDYGLDAISPCGIETMECPEKTKRFMRRWRRINALQRLRAASGIRYAARDLSRLVGRMYGNWERFTEKRRRDFARFMYPGISGNAVVARRDLFERIGQWNETAAAPDWDLQLRCVKSQSEDGRARQCMIAGDVFVHHFIRATFRARPSARACTHPLRVITEAYRKNDLVYLCRPAISVIVAVHQRPDFLEKVLAGLARQTFGDFEVVVADDGSGPEVAGVIDKWQGRFRYPVAHVRQEHCGFRKTMIANRAALRSRSDYLCFIDGDSVPHRRFLHSHLRARRVGTVLSGRRVMLDKQLTAALTLDDVENGRLERMSFWFGHAEQGSAKHGVRAPVVAALEDGWKRAAGKNYCILGSNFSLFTGDFFRVNGYEESIVGRGLEDNNLSNRFKVAGVRVRTVARSAIQYHLFHESNPIPHDRETISRMGRPQTPWAAKGIVKQDAAARQ